MPLYSYSRIGCSENCPRQYKFRYIEKPDIIKPEGVEAFMGKMVHETLEQCYQLAQRGRVMTLDELLVFYQRRWQESLPENLRIVKKEMTAEDYYNLGSKSLEMYYDRHAPFDQELTLGLERRVIFALDSEGQYKMQGYIDRLTRDSGGRLRIQDYKTSATLPTQPEADADDQLALYQIAVEEMWPDNNGIELAWHYVKFDTILVSHRDNQQLDDLKKRYIDKIRKIERATELRNFPTHETALCNWCEYFELCPAKGGPGVVADDSQVSLEPLEGEALIAIVDEYINGDRKKKLLEKRLKEIRESLKHACGIGADRTFDGSEDESIYMAVFNAAKLPTKSADSVAVDKIRSYIEESGFADNYLTIDMPALQKDFAAGTLPPDLMEKLKPFEKKIVQDRLRIKKK